MTGDYIQDLARSLDQAWAGATTVPAPTTLHPALTVEDAYAVQDVIIDGRLGRGRRIAGWKLGLTSADPPATPISGTLLDNMVVPSGSRLSQSTMVGPMVEAEIVVEMGRTLEDPATVEELAGGPHRIGGGIEVIDYRTVESQGPIDWIADNSTVAYAVVGATVPVAEVSPGDIDVVLSQDGRALASGRGDLVMGNPLTAVAWLSRHLTERGRALHEGDVVLTGSLTGHHVVPAGESEFTAVFTGLGTVSVGFNP
jgi:2-keto-4-pentenoate hydratase